MKRITIDVIPFKDMRYWTLGDYGTEANGDWWIKAAEMSHNWHLPIIVHELVEKILCDAAGITDADIDKFDIGWESHGTITEPGDDPDAPYFIQHQQATVIERMLVSFLDKDWRAYERACELSAPLSGPE